ncbi:MAG: 4-hydroxybenzoate octaprenyltransferase [Gammaproteobacteria bacterium]|nr:4-hydroxybenzoate octaprenyltransferase [Gammaproteobacteria bacterium]
MIAKLVAILQLTRLDLPVGSLLLMWPTITALWIVSEGIPPYDLLLLFIVGTVLMRSAGCVINDIADRNFDAHVKRTFKRPLADGRLSVWTALIVFAVLAALSLLVVLQLNLKTQLLAIAGFGIAVLYPFMKRVTMLPQLVLGLAFSWGIPMTSTATLDSWGFSPAIYLLFVANFCWIVVYDTIYAMVDRDDDIKLNLGSTAILAGHQVVVVVGGLMVLTLGIWLTMGIVLKLTVSFYVASLIIAVLFGYQWNELRKPDNRQGWFVAFKSNIWVGTALMIGTALGLAS